MKFHLRFALVCLAIVSFWQALPSNADPPPSPSPSVPATSPTPFPSPTIPPFPSPTISPSPTPDVSPPASPTPTPVPPLVVLPPQPDPVLIVPDPGVPLAPTNSADATQIHRNMPVMEVWAQGASSPRIAQQRYRGLAQVYIEDLNPVLVRLRFNPLAAGKLVSFQTGRGLRVPPPQTQFYVEGNGDCLIPIEFTETFVTSSIKFYCDGIRNTLTFFTRPPETMQTQALGTGGGQ